MNRLLRASVPVLALIISTLVPSLSNVAQASPAPYAELISQSSSGDTANDYSGISSISQDGRYVMFFSRATNLDPAVSGMQLYVRDRTTQQTQLVSTNSAGEVIEGRIILAKLTGDGRHVAMVAQGTNLGYPGLNTQLFHTYIKNLDTGQLAMASIDANGSDVHLTNDQSLHVSDDGNFVLLYSYFGGNSGTVKLKNMTTGSIDTIATGFPQAISGDGTMLFYSEPLQDVVNQPDATTYRYSRLTGTQTAVGITQAFTNAPISVSGDGQYVVFESQTEFVPGANAACTPDSIFAGGCHRVYRKNVDTGTIQLVDTKLDGSSAEQGTHQNGRNNSQLVISGDGNTVLWTSWAIMRSTKTQHKFSQVYAKNMTTGVVKLVSTNNAGAPSSSSGSSAGGGGIDGAYLSGATYDGSEVVYSTDADNMGVLPTCIDFGPSFAPQSLSTLVTAMKMCSHVYVSGTDGEDIQDTTAPQLESVTPDTYNIQPGEFVGITAQFSDTGSGLTGGEYFVGTDPGLGNGFPAGFEFGQPSNLSFGVEGDNFPTPGDYTVSFRAYDNVGNWTSTFTQLVTAEAFTGTAPTITSGASASTSMRVPMTNFTVTATGDPAPSLVLAGSLPAGLSFTDNGDGTGTISGTAAAGTAGTYALTFTATNGVGDPASQPFTLTVTTATSAPAITSDAADTEAFGTAFSFTITTNGYPAPKLTKTGTLPSGVTFTDNGNGTATLAGTSQNAALGSYNLTLKAKNSVASVTQAFVLTITKAPVITKVSTQTARVGVAYSKTITAKGFETPTLAVTGLPGNLSFADNGNGTGVISGVPAVGTGGSYNVTITANNSLGTATLTFVLKVNEAPVITSAATAHAEPGVPFSFQVTATGFPAPSISKTGALPSGLIYKASTRTISGTAKPGHNGTYPITLSAKNSSGTVMQSFMLTVN